MDVSMAAVAAVVAATGGASATPAAPRTSALVSHLSDMGVDSDCEVADTASSPAMHGVKVDNPHARRLAASTMTAHGAAKAGGLPRRPIAKPAVSTGTASMDSGAEGSNGKRPRRAASGGVVGAIAAATSDWGLDVVSPPPKRAASNPEMADGTKGTAAAAQRERSALLRQALRNLGSGAAHKSGGDEADAISALVSLNSQG